MVLLGMPLMKNLLLCKLPKNKTFFTSKRYFAAVQCIQLILIRHEDIFTVCRMQWGLVYSGSFFLLWLAIGARV
jgi:hypothetical protein